MATAPTSIRPTPAPSVTPAAQPSSNALGSSLPATQPANSSIPLYHTGDKLNRGIEKKVGSIDRQQLRDAALGIAISPGTKKKINQSTEANNTATRTGADARQSALTAVAIASQIPGLPKEVASFASRLQQQTVRSQQGSVRRQKEAAKLTKRIKRTFFLVIFAAFFIAAIADILSFFDVGWVVSWIIPIFTFFMTMRINRINRGAQHIKEAIARAHREITILQQRVRSSLSARQQLGALRRSATNMVSSRTSSYFSQYLIGTAAVQIAELIPVIDWLPMYIGGVLRITVDQYNAFKKAQRLIPQLQQSLATIERLEASEIEQQTQRLTTLVQLYLQQSAAEQQDAYRAIESPPPRQVLRDIQPVIQRQQTESLQYPVVPDRIPPRQKLQDIQPSPQLSPSPAL